MKAGSLRLRLLLAAAVSIVAALAIAGVFISLILERYLHGRIESELDVHMRQLAGAVSLDEDDRLSLAYELADPRFFNPLGGLYWQVSQAGKPVLSSRSLWDQSLAAATLPGLPRVQEIPGPNGAPLLALVRNVILETDKGDRRLHLVVAINQHEALEALKGFNGEIVLSLGGLALFLLLAAWLQITVGLKPLRLLQLRLNQVRLGKSRQLQGEFPTEVRPLVTELNAVLLSQEETIKRARARAGDLAHGLKTPLAILSAEGRSLRKLGQETSAHEIETQVQIMRRCVERQLARTRARGKGGSRSIAIPVATSVERLLKAMKRLPGGTEITWKTDIPNGVSVALDPEDFDDIFGNLLDNARKWARSEVTFRCRERPDAILLSVEDDGCGIPEDQLATAVARGGMLDVGKASGSGLGLAIAHDVLETYGADLEVRNGEPTGLRATARLPKQSTG